MSVSPPAPRGPAQRATVRLKDLALSDRESVFRTPRAGDWAVLALLLVGLAGCGLFTWYRLGPQHDHVGRAIFFGTLLLCAFWTAAVYTFKLSLCARVGPHGISVVRGPWRTELPWREVARMTERVQPSGGQRFRWLAVLARDGRRLQIREDLVTDYPRFRLEVFERYALWRDHGGTLGATGNGPFVTRETFSTQVSWWLVLALVVLLPGIYFALVLPETGLIGPVLIALATCCGLLSLRALLRRHTFTIDARAISARRPGSSVILPWREVTRVDRTRHRHNPLVRLGIALAGAGITLATRTDQRVQIFDWRPRVPEYLTLRGAGRHVRIALHRLPRPDDLLAWIEFYESVGRKSTARETEAQRSGAISRPQRARTTVDFSNPSASSTPASASAAPAPPTPAFGVPVPGVLSTPADPWATPTGGDAAPDEEDAWLRAEPGESDKSDEPDTVEMAHVRPASHPAPPLNGADAGDARPRGPQRSAPSAEPAPAEQQRFIAESAPRGWGAAAWQQPSPGERAWATRPDAPDAPDDMPDFPDEADPDQQQADLSADLASSFATWRTDPQWQPPPLPRFGPPPAQAAPAPAVGASGGRPPAPPDPHPGQPEQPNDSGAFAQDDFLR